jgi:hypothetical protein
MLLFCLELLAVGPLAVPHVIAVESQPLRDPWPVPEFELMGVSLVGWPETVMIGVMTWDRSS